MKRGKFGDMCRTKYSTVILASQTHHGEYCPNLSLYKSCNRMSTKVNTNLRIHELCLSYT